MQTVREADGLAMSSRNVYLNKTQRATACLLYRELRSVAETVRGGHASCPRAASYAAERLLANGFAAVEYLTVVDADCLPPTQLGAGPAGGFGGGRRGPTRLIDNVVVDDTVRDRSSSLG